jgi:hypothetical protein
MVPHSQKINIPLKNAFIVTVVVHKIASHHSMIQYQYEADDCNCMVLMKKIYKIKVTTVPPVFQSLF